MNTVKLVAVIVSGLLTLGLVKFALTFAVVAWPLSIAVGGLVSFLVFSNYDKLVDKFKKAEAAVKKEAAELKDDFKK